MSCCSNAGWKSQVARGLLSKEALAELAAQPSRKAAAAAAGTWTEILYNATFLLATPDITGGAVGAVAIDSSGAIAAVGTLQQLLGRQKAPLTDLGGATVAPGFIEAHAHIIAAVQTNYSTDVGKSVCPTYASVLAAIQTKIGGTGAPPPMPPPITRSGIAPPPVLNLPWFFFMNYDPSLLEWGGSTVGYPQLGFEQLDVIPGSQNCCIFVENASGHIAYGNTNAFLACGINLSSDPGDGGSYGQSGGALNGIMFEPPSFAPFLSHSPAQSLSSSLDAMSAFLAYAQQRGVTTVHDPAVGIGGSLEGELVLYDALARGGYATDVVGSLDLTNMYAADGKGPGVPGVVTKPSAPGATGTCGALVIPAVKLWSDGSTQGYTGYLTENYLPLVTPPGLPENGVPDWHVDEMTSLITQAKHDKWSTLVHCNGDKGLQMALDVLFALRPLGTFRDRIEHCTVTTVKQYDEMLRAGVTPTYLTNHLYIWGDAFDDHILGHPRASRLDAAADAVVRKMLFSFHCDYATSNPQPLRYMQTAVTRKTNTGRPLGTEARDDLRITPEEALNACTIYPAQQLGIDGLVGTIQTGKRANLVVLAGNPLAVDHEKIADIGVIGTYLRGTWIPGPPPIPPPA